MRLPFTFFKAGSSEYMVKFVAGQRRRAGTGIVCFVGPRTTLARIPVAERAIPFTATELTADGQQVIVQGSVRLRVLPDTVLHRLDCTIDPWDGEYLADENPEEKIADEARFVLQELVRAAIRPRALREAIAAAATCGTEVRTAAAARAGDFAVIGVEVIGVFITAIDPANPDLKRALEAEAREQMLANADAAIAARRMNAAEKDRRLKEYEADTAQQLEERRKALVEARNANVVAEAEADATAIAKRLDPYAHADPRVVLALGIRELAGGGRVGQVNFTSDFLAAMQFAGGGPNGRPE